jgi:hypothetical protein
VEDRGDCSNGFSVEKAPAPKAPVKNVVAKEVEPVATETADTVQVEDQGDQREIFAFYDPSLNLFWGSDGRGDWTQKPGSTSRTYYTLEGGVGNGFLQGGHPRLTPDTRNYRIVVKAKN